MNTTTTNPNATEHENHVRTISTEVRARVQDKTPVHIFKGGVSHFVPLPNDPRRKSQPIDISMLRNVLEINVAEQTCTAEPGLTFAELVKATLAKGLIPTVVPELEGITIGGAVAGCSVESMSYKYGGFHDSCLEYEVVTGEGEVATFSREKDPLAFDMIHGSYGTLGILTKLKFKLVPAKPYVRMEYRRFQTFAEFQRELFERCKQGDFDFVDGIVHAPDCHVVCLGQFVDQAPYLSDYRWLNIFYKSTRERTEDYLTTIDYCFRYDTECHWLTKTVPGLESKPVRLVLGKFVLGSTNLIKWSKRLESVLKFKKRPDVVVDVFIPSRKFSDFWSWYEREYSFYPLWVIPYRIPKPYPWVSDEHGRRMNDELMVDCAVYGKPNNLPDVDFSQVLEEKTYELGGIKTLISRNHYTKERFWQIYNQPNYEAVKKRLDPNGVFKGLYEKFSRVE